MTVLRGSGVAALRMDKMQIGGIGGGTRLIQTDTHMRKEFSPGQYDDFYGYNFTYHPQNGSGIGGTLIALYEEAGGISVFSLTGMSLPVPFLAGRVAANDTVGFFEAVFAKKDALYGTRLNDHLQGYAGKDTIKGGSGKDTIDGGSGNDILSGGRGKDAFVFDTQNRGVDTIRDFSPREDMIHIDRPIGQRERGNSENFALGTQASNYNDRIIYDPASGNVFFDPDGNGAQAQILLAKVKPWQALTADNFILI